MKKTAAALSGMTALYLAVILSACNTTTPTTSEIKDTPRAISSTASSLNKGDTDKKEEEPSPSSKSTNEAKESQSSGNIPSDSEMDASIKISVPTDATASQKKAINRTKKWLADRKSKANIAYHMVELDKFSEDDAQYAVEHIDADWAGFAAYRAKAYAKDFDTSEIMEQLKYDGFTDEEISDGMKLAGLS